MEKIAIDVVLLPSEEMMDCAIEINQELIKNHDPVSVLDRQTCIPHISLCMGCINKEDLPALGGLLGEIARDFQTLTLRAQMVASNAASNEMEFTGLTIQKSEELSQLHEKIMTGFQKFLTYNVDATMLCTPPEIDDVTLGWIKDYKKLHKNPEDFSPHLTIGHGTTDAFDHYFPMPFEASRLAICHLGNYCTCRELLSTVDLVEAVQS